jgi:hypothetical protein
MRQFIYKALAITFFVLLIDWAVGTVSGYVCNNLDDKISQIGTISQSLLKKEGDVLILGASCAKYHYNTKIFADSLQLEVQNTGIGGMHAAYTDLVLQAYLERCKPTCAVIDFSGQLDAGLGRMPRTIPFYGVSKPVTQYYDTEADWQQRMKLLSGLYRYNETLDLLLRHQLNEPNNTNGYAVMTGTMGHVDTVAIAKFVADSAQLRHLDHVVKLCGEQNIMLVFVLSPRKYHDTLAEQWLTNYCAQNGLHLINELHEACYYERDDLFRDDSHLNGTGADIFSKRVASQLKELLATNKQ